MSVRRRGKAWEVYVTRGGQRVRRAVRGTRAEALSAEAEIRRRLKPAPHHGLENALLRYLQDIAPRLRDEKGQKSKAKQIRPLLAGKGFDQVREVIATIKAQNLAPASKNRRLALLRRLCNLAYKDWGWIDQPVFISLLPERNKRETYLTPEQVEALAQCCTRGAGDAIRLAAYTGMRRSELFRAEHYVDGLLLIRETKSGKARVVPLHPEVMGIELPLKTTDALLRKEWVAARKAAGLEHVRFHDLRHTWASWLAQGGVDLYRIGKLLGHASPQTTARYAHLVTADLVRAVNQVAPHSTPQTSKPPVSD